MSADFRRRPGIVAAAVLVWVPAVTLVVLSARWPGVPVRVPTHWTSPANADTFQSSADAFWPSLLPTLVCGVIAIAVVVFLGNDGSRRASAFGYAALAGVATASGLLWPAEVLTALNGRTTGIENIGTPILLLLLAIPWAGLAFGVSLLGSRDATPPNSAGNEPAL
ncbi:MAG: hypothetical protein HIU88_13770 [Acidobacteria bacterium]|nr:hypothetical protein [Acidobacteriota bacterium]